MFIDWDRVKVFVRLGATDLRKQINGLAVMVHSLTGGDPLSGHLYLFSNQERRLLKGVYWDRNGFSMWLLCEVHNPGEKSHRSRK